MCSILYLQKQVCSIDHGVYKNEFTYAKPTGRPATKVSSILHARISKKERSEWNNKHVHTSFQSSNIARRIQNGVYLTILLVDASV